MIRRIRGIVIALFVLAVLAYGGVTMYSRSTADSGGPSISMDAQEVTVSVADGDSAILAGVTATDAEDGDVTDLLVVESKSNFITAGVRDVTIAAFDRDGNVTKATRRITYSDYTSPTVTLSGPLAASTSNSSALLDVITVTDCLDGDLTGQVQIVFEDTTKSVAVGEFAMRIQVSNSAGDTLDLPVTVRFYNASDEASAPQLTLTDYLIYVQPGETVDPEDYLDTLTVGRTAYSWRADQSAFVEEDVEAEEEAAVIHRYSVKIDDPVDTSAPGVYEITYSYTDSDEVTGTVRLVVVVEEG